MTRNVRMSRESLRKPWRKRRAKARGKSFCPKAAKAAKVAAFGDALNCESDPPLKILLPPRAHDTHPCRWLTL
eukprot:4764705-Prymnesium_polylepis.1